MPDPLIYLDGKTRVSTKDEWYQCRHPEILQLLQEYQYGYYPDRSQETVTATRSGPKLDVKITTGGRSTTIAATVTLPSGSGPFPVIIAIGGIDGNVFLKAGIAVVTFDYAKVAADRNFTTGAFWTLYAGRDIGILTAWAWATHRILDALSFRVPEIDTAKSGVTGCSRLGKAALAAGLFDARIAVTMPMCSGVQGAGPYRYSLSGQGENLENSKSGAPWWTSTSLSQFVNHATQLPFDARTIVAAIAPRAVILQQGAADPFTDSKGTATVTFPGAKAVFKWLGEGKQVGVAITKGGHCESNGFADVLPFVERVRLGKESGRNYDDLGGWREVGEALPWVGSLPGDNQVRL